MYIILKRLAADILGPAFRADGYHISRGRTLQPSQGRCALRPSRRLACSLDVTNDFETSSDSVLVPLVVLQPVSDSPKVT